MEIMSFRCDQKIKSELLYIQEALQDSTQSQAIKEAIHAFYLFLQEEKMNVNSPAAIFKKSGYLGSFKSDKDLSTNYKEVLTESLKNKHGKKK